MPSVLIVDSESTQRRSLSLALRLEGYRVALATSAQEVKDHLDDKQGYDVVMVDLMIPELNGLDLAREIRHGFPRARIILTSAYPLSQRQLERTECGAIGFVPKPYELDEVSRYLRSKITAAA
ncbi:MULTISPECIES: response regulator [Polyangium]|uniref:Response regulator n=2 Tax=Polyangium TaxID=55 RepID=A0A4U1IVT6_9BACT|nr:MULTISPECIES: response regulator [Polyangium]MDI1437547.1 response regulator [Polyangium sorediatum]TKC98624.1 response regulator [Polyangium fumosum]